MLPSGAVTQKGIPLTINGISRHGSESFIIFVKIKKNKKDAIRLYHDINLYIIEKKIKFHRLIRRKFQFNLEITRFMKNS